MELLKTAIRQMISISDEEISGLLQGCYERTFSRKAFLSQPGKVPHEIFFIRQGIIRVLITDRGGTEHSASLGKGENHEAGDGRHDPASAQSSPRINGAYLGEYPKHSASEGV